MGNVLQANNGQAPARQAAIYAGLSKETPCTTVNKVCSSGMKSIMLGAQAIKSGDAEVVVVGGMENMSAVPHYLPTSRNGQKLGDIKMVDGLVKDGLTDVFNQVHMGSCAEICADDMNFTREQQDAFALESYRRSTEAWSQGNFADEIVPVEVPQRRGDALIINEDEEYKNLRADKVPQLKPVFKKDGTVTAANASTLNDGASALIIMSADKANELGLKPLAKILSYADAAQESEWFTTAPAKAVPKALAKAGKNISEIDYFELNEAFSVVGLANIELLKIDAAKTNVNGGAVSLGHPLGSSGSRIVVSLINVLKQNGGKFGAAGICNGGGGASAIVLENM
jgi:acetyl-CoA C-acetyltransferase